MTQLLERKQVPAEHRWNLEDLFSDQKAWDQEFQKVKDSLGKISAFQGKLSDAAAVKQCFQLEDEVSVKTERLYVYANMKHHEDTAEPDLPGLIGKSQKNQCRSWRSTLLHFPGNFKSYRMKSFKQLGERSFFIFI